MNDGSRLYRARFQWQPRRTVHDPANILTLENVAAQTYTFAGDVALAFAVAGPVTFTDIQVPSEALTFAVSSPVAITWTATGEVDLAFSVGAAAADTFAEPAELAFTFSVGATVQLTAVCVGDVGVTLAAAAPFEYISAATVAPAPSGGALGVLKSWPVLLPDPREYAFTGGIRLWRLGVAGAVSAGVVPPASISLPKLWAASEAVVVTDRACCVRAPRLRARSSWTCDAPVRRRFEDELVLAGVL